LMWLRPFRINFANAFEDSGLICNLILAIRL
jgi:hypothetical protein